MASAVCIILPRAVCRAYSAELPRLVLVQAHGTSTLSKKKMK